MQPELIRATFGAAAGEAAQEYQARHARYVFTGHEIVLHGDFVPGSGWTPESARAAREILRLASRDAARRLVSIIRAAMIEPGRDRCDVCCLPPSVEWEADAD